MLLCFSQWFPCRYKWQPEPRAAAPSSKLPILRIQVNFRGRRCLRVSLRSVYARVAADDNGYNEKDEAFNSSAFPEDPAAFSMFDDCPSETEEEVIAGYEELYGPAFSGVSVLGNDVRDMDRYLERSSIRFLKKEDEDPSFTRRVVEIRSVARMTTFGTRTRFRVLVVIGDKMGHVGVGIGKDKELRKAIIRGARDAKRYVVTVPLTKHRTFTHRSDGKYGAAKVLLRPSAPGSGVIAGGVVREVLEMAGLENAIGKQLGSRNRINNARAVLVAVQKMRHFHEIAADRGITVEQLFR